MKVLIIRNNDKRIEKIGELVSSFTKQNSNVRLITEDNRISFYDEKIENFKVNMSYCNITHEQHPSMDFLANVLLCDKTSDIFVFDIDFKIDYTERLNDFQIKTFKLLDALESYTDKKIYVTLYVSEKCHFNNLELEDIKTWFM